MHITITENYNMSTGHNTGKHLLLRVAWLQQLFFIINMVLFHACARTHTPILLQNSNRSFKNE